MTKKAALRKAIHSKCKAREKLTAQEQKRAARPKTPLTEEELADIGRQMSRGFTSCWEINGNVFGSDGSVR